MRRNALAGWLLLAPSLILIVGLILYPIGYNLWLSLFDKHAFMPAQKFVGLQHYRYFLSDPEFWNAFYYGSVYAAVTMVLQLMLGVAAALLLNEAFRGAAAGPMKGILGVSDEPLVSTDFRGDSRSSIIDAASTMVLGGTMVKVIAWYDNEWGYSSRCADLVRLVAAKLPSGAAA